MEEEVGVLVVVVGEEEEMVGMAVVGLKVGVVDIWVKREELRGIHLEERGEA